MIEVRKAFCWALGEIREKLDVRETWKGLKAVGQKYGRRFFIAAVLWELFEDVVIPIILYNVGLPELIPAVLVLHGEPIVYPVFFFAFKSYDRWKGVESPYPDRQAYSNVKRTAVKTLLYRTLALLVFVGLLRHLDMSLWALTFYSLVMTFLNMVHERLWHDSNYGIVVETDQVETKRVWMKALSYRLVSSVVMLAVFTSLLGTAPLMLITLYQSVMLCGYYLLESRWAKSAWGIEPVT